MWTVLHYLVGLHNTKGSLDKDDVSLFQGYIYPIPYNFTTFACMIATMKIKAKEQSTTLQLL